MIKKEKLDIDQLRRDYQYLLDSIDIYEVDIMKFKNEVLPKMLDGAMSMEEFMVWNINDIVNYVLMESKDAIDTHFLEHDEEALNILEKYVIGCELY